MIRKKTLILLIKIIVVIAAYMFTIHKIVNSSDLEKIPEIIKTFGLQEFIILISVFLLMVLNWTVETIKWMNVLPLDTRINFKNSFKAVFSGITLGSVTPNRIGEFGGRVVFLKSDKRKKAVAYTLLADLSQFITTIYIGSISFSIIGYKVLLDYSSSILPGLVLISFGILSLSFGLVFYFYPKLFLKLIIRYRILKKYHKKIEEICMIEKNKLWQTLAMSNFRFIIFILQFFLVINILGLNISFIHTFLAVSNIYLASTLIPNIAAGELGIRSSFAIIFLGYYSDSLSIIVLASLVVYIINLAIPALLGGMFLLNKKSSK